MASCAAHPLSAMGTMRPTTARGSPLRFTRILRSAGEIDSPLRRTQRIRLSVRCDSSSARRQIISATPPRLLFRLAGQPLRCRIGAVHRCIGTNDDKRISKGCLKEGSGIELRHESRDRLDGAAPAWLLTPVFYMFSATNSSPPWISAQTAQLLSPLQFSLTPPPPQQKSAPVPETTDSRERRAEPDKIEKMRGLIVSPCPRYK